VDHRLFGTVSLVAFASTCFSFGGGGGTWVAGGVVSGTLLGPEGSGALLRSFSVRALPVGRTAMVSLLGVWLAAGVGGVPPVF
jgi:hypothetical protein